MTTCPKCRYVCSEADTVLARQCPSCGIAYSKVTTEACVPPPRVRDASRSAGRDGRVKWITMAFAVLGIYLGFAQPWRHEHTLLPIVAEASAGQPEVLLYATSWCPYCAKTREFLRMRGIQYTEYDIEHDAAAAEDYRRLGGNGVPVVVVGDEVVHGYDPDRMTALLRRWLKKHPTAPGIAPEQAKIDARGV